MTRGDDYTIDKGRLLLVFFICCGVYIVLKSYRYCEKGSKDDCNYEMW